MPEDTSILDTPPSAPTLTGTAALMDDVLKGVPETPDNPPPSQTPPPAKATTPTPEKPATPPPAKPDKVDPKAQTPPAKPAKEDMNTLRKTYEATKAELETYKTKTVVELQDKIKQLESKRVFTDDDAKKVEAAESQIAELRGKLSQRDYTESDEYKKTYVEPWNRTLEQTKAMVKNMQVRVGDDGQTRAGTESDFWQVAQAPAERQAELATQLFGANALRVISAIDRLTDYKIAADAALNQHAEKQKGLQAQQQDTLRKTQELYDRTHQQSTKELQEAYAEHFGEDANDPESNEKIKSGFAKVDEWLQTAPTSTIEERAQKAAVIRAWAAAFPRNVHRITKLQSENASLKEELAKFRKSDPGAASDTGKPTGKSDDDSGLTGTAKMLAEFDK